MRHRMRIAAGVAAVIAAVALIVVGALEISDRVADEAIERAPIPRTTPTPRATAPPVVVTPPPTLPPEIELVVTAPMPHPERQQAAAVVLADGRVLIVGGSTPLFFGRVGVFDAFGPPVLDSAVLYDPRTDRWSEVQAPANPRWGALMVLAGDGRPILWGGNVRTEFGSGFTGQASHERFDWLTGEWERLRGPTFSATVQLLVSETRVYAVNQHDLYRFDPSSTSWTLVEEGPTARVALGALALADGRVVMFVEDERSPIGGFRSGGETLVQEAASRFQYVVIDPRTGTRSAVRVVEGPPYRPQIYALADGSLLLFGGFKEDPTEWEIAIFASVAPSRGSMFDADTGEPVTATPTATPPPRPEANETFFRLDVDSGVVTELEVGDEDPEGTFRLNEELYTLVLPSMPVTAEGAERLYAALEGRVGAVVLPLDGSRVLVAGGAAPTPEAIAAIEAAIDIPDGVTFVPATSLEVDAVLTAAGLETVEERYAPLDAVIIRVN